MKPRDRVLWLFFWGVCLIGLGLYICGRGLYHMGVPWPAIRGVYQFIVGGYLIWWGINILNKKVK